MSGTAKDFIDVAKSLVGNVGGDKIRKWYNENISNLGASKWAYCCATMVYCACKSGSSNLVNHTASSSAMMNWFKSRNRFHYRNGYTPKTGDLILFDYITNDGMPASHIGCVEYVKDGYVHTIENNTGNKPDGECMRHTYALSYSKIVGYCNPDYKAEPKKEIKVKFKKNGALYSVAYKDLVGGASTPQVKLNKGQEVTYIKDDKFGWSKVKYKNKEYFCLNPNLDKTGLSKLKEKTLSKPISALLVTNNKAGSKVEIPKGRTIKIVCSIEKGKYKGYCYFKIGKLKYYSKEVKL